TGGNFTAIDAALWLRNAHAIQPESIRRIKIALPLWSVRRAGPRTMRPHTLAAARGSVRFAVAAALSEGEVTHRQLTETKLNDPSILRLQERIEFDADAEVESLFEATKMRPQFFVPCRVEIETHDNVFRRLEPTPRGYDPARGL